jgi:hypothetical protein
VGRTTGEEPASGLDVEGARGFIGAMGSAIRGRTQGAGDPAARFHAARPDPQGKLVYEGAIDHTKGGEPEEGEKVVNYVAVALGELEAGKPVSTPQTEAFGCGVKY